MSDEFSDALAGAINRPADDDDGDAAELLRDEVDGDASLGSGGGDIDDDRAPQDLAPRIQYQRQLEERKQQAEKNRDGWLTESQRREAVLADAQMKHKAARRASLEYAGDESLDAEQAALQQILDARSAVDEAKRHAQTWSQDYDAAANMPQLTAAEQEWIDSNPRFLTDDAFKSQAQRLMQRAKEDGLDPSSAPTLRKISEQLRSAGRMGGSRRTPGAPAVHTESRTDRPGGEQMEQVEAKFIRRLGYDPSDKRVRDQWVRSKSNTRRIARSRGA